MSEENKDLNLEKNIEEVIKSGSEDTTDSPTVILKEQQEDDAAVIKKTISTEGEDYTPEAVEIDLGDTDNIGTAHDDFDWSIGNRHKLAYSDSEIEAYDKDYSATLNSLAENAIVKGIITSVTDGDAVLDVKFKSDGLISLSEFRDMPDMKIGDEVEVYVEQQEDDKGRLILSRRKAKLLRSWESLVDSYTEGTIIKGTIVSKTKGGLIADCGGLETFLPGSQIDIKPIIDYDAYVGKTMEFKVVKINEAIKNAVVSHKALIESDLAEQRDQIIAGLEKGQVLEGLVKNITDFGAFMDLGGVDGLLYITDISWGRISHPSEIIELNQKLNVVVLDFDENKKRISLGLKQLQSHPWDVLGADIVEGSTVRGKIVNIEDYGAFLEITPGVEGLIHVSEVSWSNQAVNAREFFKLGQEFDSKVVTIDREERKMSLSIKQLHEDPWTKIIDKFPTGTKHSGEVKNLTPYGVFVELEEGIGGMIHISDLSWTKRYSHPSEFTKVGEKIDITILDIDKESRKLSLGHKQLEENPWDTFENVFPIGSYHEATIVKADDRGAIVSLPYGLEAYSPARHLKKDDGSSAKAEETLTFKVIEFNRDDKRILVSHRRYLDDIKRDADQSVKNEKQKERKETVTHIQKTNSKSEKATLGDLGVFSQLKEQMAEGASTAPTPAAKKAEEAPKVEEKKAEEVKVEAPKAAPVVEEKKEEAPKVEEKKAEPVVEEVKAEEPKEEAKAEKPAATGKPDDLKKIEGIGPKISELMAAGGYPTFALLAKADVEDLKKVLDDAGPRYRMHSPDTWPQQAALAAEGKWDELKKWQDELDGGKA